LKLLAIISSIKNEENMNYEPVIGLEVHVQLNTATKIFCSCSTKFGAEPNTQVCPVCLGLPGVLPVLNEEALKKAILAGLSLNCSITENSKFDRKNYFYPDLPKAYQISQYDRPVCGKGYIEIVDEGTVKKIGITRLHLEEDAGKSIHSDDASRNVSYVDLNRTGVPLAEIVSEPDMRSGNEAYEYLQKIKSLMKYIDISDVNMEEGSLRCDVNISLRKTGTEKFGEKVEIKNLNSFKAVRASINFEIKRQTSMLDDNEKISQETRLWDSDKNETYSMRSKEDAHDYRYFPDPDLPPITITSDYIEKIRKTMPELPDARRIRFTKEFGLPDYDSSVLTSSRKLADYYETVVNLGANPKKTSNWIMSELLARIEDVDNIDKFVIKPEMLASLLKLIDNDTISGKIAKTVLDEMISSGKNPEIIVKEKGLEQVTDTGEIETVINRVLENNQKSVEDYKSGKDNALKFLIGQVMKESKGKANPQIVNDILLSKIK
jgi:aspartyl-tRNA(Asn)/glutamyl-tRNA(Gln) amidotransferase subunit B